MPSNLPYCCAFHTAPSPRSWSLEAVGGPGYPQGLLSFAAYLRLYLLQKAVNQGPCRYLWGKRGEWGLKLSPTSPHRGSCWQGTHKPLVDMMLQVPRASLAPAKSVHFKICPRISPPNTRFSIVVSHVRPDWLKKGKFVLLCFNFLNFPTVCLHGRAEAQIHSTCW